jgi:2-epi-5-epi-valiolone synthase
MYRMHCETSRHYDVLLTPRVLDPDHGALAEAIGSRRALVVTDPTVDRLYGSPLITYLAQLPSVVTVHVADLSEHSKTMASVIDVCAAAQRHGLGRRDLLVAFGGGICCDVVSVAASLIRRGIPYICVPTTLVAQVDAGIALKGGVNFRGTKNYLGCFAPPHRVLLDPTLLRTVPAPELSSGLAEILKIALVLDARLFDRLRQVGSELLHSGFTSPPGAGEEVIEQSVRLMLDELSANCYEDAVLERLVDFGHTFSGRLEELSHYQLRHGEAVALDMALTCTLGVELGLLAERELMEVIGLLRELGLPTQSRLCTPDVLFEAMHSTTAHRDGALNLVVPTTIGKATFVRDPLDIPGEVVDRALARFATVTAHGLISTTGHGVPA